MGSRLGLDIDMVVVGSGWHWELWGEGIGQVWKTVERLFLCGLVVLIALEIVAWCQG